MADDRYRAFPAFFFSRMDESPDGAFYRPTRLVTHIDDGAIAAVGQVYAELGIDGSQAADRQVLDLMSSWVSHFITPPSQLSILGMNAAELEANAAATERVVQDLNTDPALPWLDASFDAVTCCVSVDYLVRPLEVFDEAHRVLRPGGLLVCTFSNRCFPTKAIRGWLQSDDEAHVAIVRAYFASTGPWAEVVGRLVTPVDAPGDPLFAVWGRRA